MTAEILAVGTELLLGDIVNTNGAFVARELAKLGISVYWQTTVGDNPERLHKAYETAYLRGADLIIAIGGLGPTEDDITKEVAADFFGLPLVLHEPSWQAIEEIFSRSSMPMSISNKKQAMLPEGCHVFPNHNGTAPGLCIERDNRLLMMFPGPPNEIEPMFVEQAVPFLRKRSETVFISKTLKVVGVGESMAAQRIKPLLDAQTNPTIAPYAKPSEVWLRITASAENETLALEKIAPVNAQIREILGDAVYGEDNDTLEGVVVELLRRRKFAIACAESCTGGMLTARLVDYPGVSEVLRESVVAYANEAKMKLLGVSEAVLNRYGAVSAETAAAMAEGASALSGAEVGLSTTGIAGPSGGTLDKPVGLVYIGLHIKGKGTQTKRLNLNGDRSKIRARAVVSALDFLRRALIENS